MPHCFANATVELGIELEVLLDARVLQVAEVVVVQLRRGRLACLNRFSSDWSSSRFSRRSTDQTCQPRSWRRSTWRAARSRRRPADVPAPAPARSSRCCGPTLITPTLSYLAGVPGAAKPGIHVTPKGIAADRARWRGSRGARRRSSRRTRRRATARRKSAATHTAAIVASRARSNPPRLRCTARPFGVPDDVGLAAAC